MRSAFAPHLAEHPFAASLELFGHAESRSALRCKDLVKRYGDTVAVAGLDLEVWRGECFGMLGPNGAGKTTTVEIFEGLRVRRLRLGRGARRTLARRRFRACVRVSASSCRRRNSPTSCGSRGRDSFPQLLPARPGRRGRARAGGAARRRPARRCARCQEDRSNGCPSRCALVGDPELLFPRRADDRPRSPSRAARPGRSSKDSRRAGGRYC